MGRSDKLVKNISFIVIGNIGSKLMGFFMLPFYTNWLSPADYGTTDLLIVYANLLLNVVACDISDAIYIYPVGATKQKVCNYYSTGFIFQFLCSIICLFVFWVGIKRKERSVVVIVCTIPVKLNTDIWLIPRQKSCVYF